QLLRGISWRAYWDVVALLISLFVIGIGSGLWHSVATKWAVVADVIPIYVFINLYIFSLFIRLIGLHWFKTLLIWLVFSACNVWIQTNVPSDVLNGSLMYIPPLVMLGVATTWLRLQYKHSWKPMAAISVLFLISLTFRTIDTSICSSFPYGTHFIWHTLNAWVLYSLVKLLVPKQA
ncbi:MAG: hypothetical protein CMM93_03615, partial [Rickettsiales bacterium]|nr:hypothetical protein [Rickettsiales bacterium]